MSYYYVCKDYKNDDVLNVNIYINIDENTKITTFPENLLETLDYDSITTIVVYNQVVPNWNVLTKMLEKFYELNEIVFFGEISSEECEKNDNKNNTNDLVNFIVNTSAKKYYFMNDFDMYINYSKLCKTLFKDNFSWINKDVSIVFFEKDGRDKYHRYDARNIKLNKERHGVEKILPCQISQKEYKDITLKQIINPEDCHYHPLMCAEYKRDLFCI